MKIGLQIPNFTRQGGGASIGPRLAEIAHTADEIGFDRPGYCKPVEWQHHPETIHQTLPEHA